MNVGTLLRETRERGGMTLRQIADSTKLSMPTLHDIERNAFERLAGGIYTKGYLRAYAAELGLDPEEVVRGYLEQCGTLATRELPIARAPAVEDRVQRPWYLLAAAVGSLVALVAYSSDRESPTVPLMQLGQPAPEPVRPVATGDTVSPALAAAAVEQGLYLDIEATGACWVSATADGRLVLARLIQDGERVTVVARDELVLRVGEPTAFAYTLNGASGRLLGAAGKPVTVQITERNYRTFLADSAAPRRVSTSVT